MHDHKWLWSAIPMSTEAPLLTFGFSTTSQRIKNLKRPDCSLPHEVIAFVQNPKEQSYVFDLPKSTLVELKSSGVAKSRNAALKHASGKYLIFGDDDIRFLDSGICQAIDYFESHPECSIILAQTNDETGSLRKRYESQITPLKLTNSARAATYELLVRVDAIREAGVAFDEEFGAGAKNFLGDEYIFIADSLRKGLKGVHFPAVVAVHPTESSGSRWGSDEDLAARAKVFTRVFGWKAPIARLGFLLRTSNKKPGLFTSLRFIFGK